MSSKREKEEEEKREFIPNPQELDGVPDLSQLIYMEMPNVLHNVRHRYCDMKVKKCYTSISSICNAACKAIPLPACRND